MKKSKSLKWPIVVCLVVFVGKILIGILNSGSSYVTLPTNLIEDGTFGILCGGIMYFLSSLNQKK